jgi:Uroporphyrinogen-III synthase
MTDDPVLPLLKGKQVLVTRAQHQSAAMCRRIRAYGGVAVTVPLIGYRKAPLTDAERKGWLEEVQKADWVIFTSGNSLDFFMKVLDRRDRLSHVKLAAVGKKTGERLGTYEFKADFIPDHFSTEGIVAAFSAGQIKAGRVVVPLGSLSDRVWLGKLRDLGIKVTDRILYQTVADVANQKPLREIIESGRLSAITFASPSAVRFFTYLLPETVWRRVLTSCTVAVIGPTTAQAVNEALGSMPDVIPDKFTAIDMIDALANDYYKKGSLHHEQ